MSVVIVLLQIGSAVSAIAAAVFWFLSAFNVPPMTYEGMERLEAVLNQAALRNRWAASLTGVSALLAGIATLAGLV